MEPMTLKRVAELAGGRVAGSADALCLSVSKDSRRIRQGDLYIALQGSNFDGHDFVEDALKAGAVAAMVADHTALRWPGANLVLLPFSPLEGLQRLAANWRRSLRLEVLGVTGSNGKTSVKDMCASVLGRKFSVVATQGNYNNAIGVPLTLLSANPSHQYAVVEMGMNHAGEIAPLAEMAAPRMGIVTNVGRAHIEFLGSREAIAVEKGALLRALPRDGTAILPHGDDFIETLRHGVQACCVEAGVGGGDVAAYDIRPDGDGMVFRVEARGRSLDCRVPKPGMHMVHNATLAIAAGLEAGLTLEECREGLAQTIFTDGRLQLKMVAGVNFIDDSYNANPESMKSGLEVLATVPGGRRWAVLGAMNELGEHAASAHEEVGAACAAVGLDGLITLGHLARGIARAARDAGCPVVREAQDHEEAARVLHELSAPGDVVLLKGSRTARCELVLDAFDRLSEGAGSDTHPKKTH